MLTKLAFKNVGKSIRDFTVYFFTLAFGVCVFYMFNSIYAQQAMFDMTKKQTETVQSICEILSYVSIFVAVILGFLIVYANGFFIKRRKKELGIYMTLGMSKRKISLILVLETSLIALLALVVGIFGGIFLSQFMSVFTAKIFEVDMTSFEFVFSFDAMIKSILYFGVIFVIVIIFNVISISRFKLIDLIYGGRKNQKLKIRNTKINAILCILSMVILGLAYYLIIDNGMLYINEKFCAAIVLGIIGTLLFFFSLSGLLTVLISRNKKLYCKNLNMFVVRQLGSNINTNFISISVVSIVLLFTIGIFATGYGIQNVFSKEIKNMALYDYSFESSVILTSGETWEYTDPENPEESYILYSANNLADLKEFISKNEYVKNYDIYKEYLSDITHAGFGVALPEGYEAMGEVLIRYVSVSDYNKQMELIGGDKLELDDEHYVLLSNYSQINSYYQSVVEANAKLTIGSKTLYPLKQIEGSVCNMEEGIVIVSDKIAEENKENCIYYMENLNVNLNDKSDEEKFENQIAEYTQQYAEKNSKELYTSYISKTDIYNSSITVKALLSFLAIYLGIVFMVTCAAILAIQQLTEASENKSRYELLAKLGADKKMLNKALFVQIFCYFIFPLVLGVVHSVFGLIAVQKTLVDIVTIDISATLLPTGIFVGLLYTAYFLLTYISSKSIIK